MSLMKVMMMKMKMMMSLITHIDHDGCLAQIFILIYVYLYDKDDKD